MRLSEAIREGAKLRPQTLGKFFEINATGNLESCAIGAAFEATHGQVEDDDPPETWLVDEWVQTLWPFLGSLNVTCPVDGCRCIESTTGDEADNILTHMNDYHRWTRERIADWVATVEPAEAV